MEKNDCNRWFIAEGTMLKCPLNSFKLYCKQLFGDKWYEKYKMFRKATFEEHCRIELEFLNE